MEYHCKRCGWQGEVGVDRPRCLECSRRSVKAWRARNPEKVAQQKARYDKRFRATRPEEYRAKRRRNYLPATAKKARTRRIVWLKNGTVTSQDLRELAALYNFRCVYCGVKVKPRYTPFDPRGFDHVVSRVKGGKHERSNIVPCCRNCNELKG